MKRGIMACVLIGLIAFLMTNRSSENLTIGAIPDWIQTRIENEFKPYEQRLTSAKEVDLIYEKKSSDYWQLVKFKISKNKVSFESKIPKYDFFHEYRFLHKRIRSYEKAINKLVSITPLPDMTFLIALHDAIAMPEGTLEGIPVFVMCKHKEGKNGVLIPDFDALANGFQVLKGKDITQFQIPWENKSSTLIWRGSTAYDGIKQTLDNLDANIRIKLCAMSKDNPGVIDAKFTIFAQGAKSIPSLKQFRGAKVSYEDQLNFKYQMLIDGNAASFSASGWKLFTNSLVFKPDSPWIQWYYYDLKPWVHYIPLRTDLADLLEKIHWAQEHDEEAKAIARNARDFALEHITESNNLAYLYAALMKYNQLQH